MIEVSKKVQDAIRAEVLKDLEPSPLRAHAKVAASLVLGGGISLALCGQFGVGLTPWAKDLHGAVMQLSTFVPCMVLCGVIFAVFPVVALRALCRPMEFRAIMRKRPFHLAGWLLGFELFLAWHGGFTEGAAGLAVWFGASIACIVALGRLLDWGLAGSNRAWAKS